MHSDVPLLVLFLEVFLVQETKLPNNHRIKEYGLGTFTVSEQLKASLGFLICYRPSDIY